jgi:hypothetical protein
MNTDERGCSFGEPVALDEVVQETRDLEAETEGLLEQVLDFSKN